MTRLKLVNEKLVRLGLLLIVKTIKCAMII